MRTEMTDFFGDDEIVDTKQNVTPDSMREKESIVSEEVMGEETAKKETEDEVVAEPNNADTTTETMSESAGTNQVSEEAEEKQRYIVDEISDVVRKEYAGLETKITAISASLNEVRNKLSSLASYEKTVETLSISLKASQRREDNMANELAEYKKDLYFSHIRSCLEFLSDFHMDISKSKRQYETDKDVLLSSYGDKAYKEIISLHEFMLDYLENYMKLQGMEIKKYEEGSEYIPGEHTILKAVVTHDADLNGKIAKADENCYMYRGKVLKSARVHTYVYKRVATE